MTTAVTASLEVGMDQLAKSQRRACAAIRLASIVSRRAVRDAGLVVVGYTLVVSEFTDTGHLLLHATTVGADPDHVAAPFN